jgi:hypothetical protein
MRQHWAGPEQAPRNGRDTPLRTAVDESDRVCIRPAPVAGDPARVGLAGRKWLIVSLATTAILAIVGIVFYLAAALKDRPLP